MIIMQKIEFSLQLLIHLVKLEKKSVLAQQMKEPLRFSKKFQKIPLQENISLEQNMVNQEIQFLFKLHSKVLIQV